MREDLEHYGCSIVIFITPEGRICEDVHFGDEDGKIAAYTSVVQRAKASGATVIVTINAARTTTEPWTVHDFDSYWWGKLAAEGARDCISITASGPGMKSVALDLAYDIVDGKVRFDPDPEFMETEIGMLPDWPPAQSTAVS